MKDRTKSSASLLPHVVEGGGQKLLHFVLPDLVDEPVLDGIGLQHVDGFVQVEFAGRPEVGTRPAAQFEDLKRVEANLGMVDRRIHDCPPPSSRSSIASTQRKPSWPSKVFSSQPTPPILLPAFF